MSVINNVLKDLDGRPSQFTPLDLSLQQQQRARNGRRKWLWIAVLVVVLLVLGLAWRWRHQPLVVTDGDKKPANMTSVIQPSENPRQSVLATNNSPQVAAVNAAKTLAAPVLPAPEKKPPVSGMQIREHGEYVELSLPVAADAQVFLRRHTRNQYVFTLSNNERQIIAPEIQDNPWLNKVQLEQTKRGTDIRFDVAERVLVQTDYADDNGRHQWRIRFTRKPPAPALKARVSPSLIAAKKMPQIATAKPASTVASVAPESVHPVNTPLQQAPVKLRIKTVKKQPSADQRYRQALQAMRQGEVAQARSVLQRLLGGKLDRQARLSLLKLYQSRRQITAMQHLLAQSLERYPQDKVLRTMDAAALFGAGEYDQLLARYGHESGNIAIINFIAAAQQKVGDYVAAIKSYQKSLKLNPQQPRNWVSMAISLEQQKRFDAALQAYQAALGKGGLNQRLQQFTHDRIQQLSDGR